MIRCYFHFVCSSNSKPNVIYLSFVCKYPFKQRKAVGLAKLIPHYHFLKSIKSEECFGRLYLNKVFEIVRTKRNEVFPVIQRSLKVDKTSFTNSCICIHYMHYKCSGCRLLFSFTICISLGDVFWQIFFPFISILILTVEL